MTEHLYAVTNADTEVWVAAQNPLAALVGATKDHGWLIGDVLSVERLALNAVKEDRK